MSDLNRREEFRVSRLKEMERVSADLLGAITEALDAGLVGPDFAEYIADPLYASFVAQYEAEQRSPFAVKDTPKKAWDWFYGRVKSGLEAVVASSESKRIADWLGTATVNGAKTAGTESERQKMWLSRRDDKVRPFHEAADGQTVGWSQPFTVCDGVEMQFPGDPVGDPECWLNCRCVVSDSVIGEAITAAADPNATGKVIVAIPTRDDEIWNVSSEPTPHMTMIWLGKQEFSDEDWKAILGGVASAADQFGEFEGPQELAVTSREPLGDDDADVLMLDPGRMANLRDYMLTHEKIKAAYDAVDQYPQWTPHLTLGYPTSPAKGDPGETIRFDRLAVWDGDYEGEEYPMSVAVEEDAPVVDDTDPGLPLADDEELVADPIPWNGVLAPEGVPSGDGRSFAEGALTWRDLPIPLLWQKSNGMGHEGAVIVGQITDIWRDANLLRAKGFFAATPEADEVIGLYAEGHSRGVSVDVDSAELAVEDEEAQSVLFSKGRISAATLCAIPAFAEAYIVLGEYVGPEEEALPMVASPTGPVTGGEDVPLPFAKMGACGCRGCDTFDCGEVGCSCCWSYDKDDNPVFAPEHPRELAASAVFKRGPGWVTDPVPTKRIHDYWTKPGQEGYAKIAWGTPGDFRRLRAHLAKFIGPEFLNRTVAQWHHDALGYWPGEKGMPGNAPLSGQTMSASVVLLADAALPPLHSQWFANPELTGPTPLTVTDDGRVFGHLATWGTCHIGIPGTCVEAPSSPTEYAYFHTGAVMTEAGLVPVGQITMDTGHAPLSANARAAAAHYDHSGAVVADIHVGDDEFGIWVAGALRDHMPVERVRALRAGALSGDWRAVRGALELVAALLVNVPGFPIPRTGLAASGGHQTSLVAAGILPASVTEDEVQEAVADLVAAVADEVEARATRRSRAAVLLASTKEVRVNALLNKMEV